LTSQSGERKGSKFKTLPLDASEATAVGTAIPGWETESTNVGAAPPGWESITNESEAVPDDWKADTNTTAEIPAAPQPKTATAAGPPANYDLAAPDPLANTDPTIPPKAGTQPAPASGRPPIEVEVRRVSNAVSITRKPPPAFEIWTKNRVYALDTTMACVEVIDLATGQSDAKHPFVGAQLVGGQSRVSGSNELTFPLPTPGADAVFQTLDANKRPRLMVTSKVTRVLLHVQVVRVSEKNRDDTWGKLASTRRIPPTES